MNPEYLTTIFLISNEPKRWPDKFAIITAYNPMDQKLSDHENKLRNDNLLKRISRNFFLEIFGSSPDQCHQEPSFAFISNLKDAIEVGKEFQQRAIYYVSHGNLQLIECNTGITIELGKFNDRLSLDQHK